MMLQNECVDDDLEHFEDIIEGPEAAIPSSNKSVNSDGSAASQNVGIPYHEEDNGPVGGGSDDELRSNAVGYDREDAKKPALPAGYDPRHREPSYCNADRTSWWELTVLASHVHPSVATMARTLLAGTNIVYNGDPINDLSLNAFLDKFMEKKPKPNKKAEDNWHGGSKIAPARKIDLNHHLVGDAILDLAEEEVPPEDVVFHRFYRNKTSSKKPKSKKKKKGSAEDEDAEELVGIDDSDDEIVPDASDDSEQEEIDNMLGSGPIPLEENGGDYDYDDLDKVAGEEDEDLLEDDDLPGDDSDAETGSPAKKSGTGGDNNDDDEEGDSPAKKGSSNNDDDDDNVASLDIWEDDAEDSDDGGDVIDDGSNESKQKYNGKKRKSHGRDRPSPFASLEEYEHLMKEDVEDKKKSKSRKKRGKISN